MPPAKKRGAKLNCWMNNTKKFFNLSFRHAWAWLDQNMCIDSILCAEAHSSRMRNSTAWQHFLIWLWHFCVEQAELNSNSFLFKSEPEPFLVKMNKTIYTFVNLSLPPDGLHAVATSPFLFVAFFPFDSFFFLSSHPSMSSSKIEPYWCRYIIIMYRLISPIVRSFVRSYQGKKENEE